MPKRLATLSPILCTVCALLAAPSAFAQDYRNVLTAEALSYSGKGAYENIGSLRSGVLANVGAFLSDSAAQRILGPDHYPAYANSRLPIRCATIVTVDMKIVMEGYTLADSPDKFMTITGSNVMRAGGLIYAGPYQAELFLQGIPFCKRPSDKESILTNLGVALFDFHDKRLVAVLTEHRYPIYNWQSIGVELYDKPRPTGADGFPDGALVRPLN